MEDNLVAIQAQRIGPTNKKCLSIPLPENNANKGMQPSLDVDGEGGNI